jgi:DNA-binding MarR family transcriptional regulator
MTSTKLQILTFFRNHQEKEFSIKELCTEFDISQPAMWKNIRELWGGNWIIKQDNNIPAKYKYNELINVITKT